MTSLRERSRTKKLKEIVGIFILLIALTMSIGLSAWLIVSILAETTNILVSYVIILLWFCVNCATGFIIINYVFYWVNKK